MSRIVDTPKGKRILVEAGDSQWQIAKQIAKDPNRWKELAPANPQKRTTMNGTFVSLVPGEYLYIPQGWPQEAPPAPLTEATGWTEPRERCSACAGSHEAGHLDAGALPAGWSQDDVDPVKALANAWDVSTDDLVVTWFAESGLQPHLVTKAGAITYGGLIMGAGSLIDPSMAWAPGTWERIVREAPTGTQIQAIALIWDKLFKSYLPKGESLAHFAERMGVSPAAVIHALNFLPARVARLQSKLDPITKSTDHDPGTRSGSFYGDNAPLDLDRDGAITLKDLDTQAAQKLAELEGSKLGAIARAARGAPDQSVVAALSPFAHSFQAITGRNPNLVNVGYAPSSGGGVGTLVLLALAIGAGLAAYHGKL